MALLSKRLRALILSENYLLFKHFLSTFNLLNDRMKRADIPVNACIMTLLRENLALKEDKPKNLDPFCYYTDGGTYQDSTKYFINNIFSRSGICYSTKVPKNANVQLYLGRKVECNDPSKMQPADHKVHK